MYTLQPAVALRDTLLRVAADRATRTDDIRQAVLRARVRAVVEDLKSVGWGPERVIVAVKQIAADAGLRPTRALLIVGAPLTESDAVVVSLVRWCVEAYYGVQIETR